MVSNEFSFDAIGMADKLKTGIDDANFYEGLFESEGGGITHTVKGDLGGTTKWGLSARSHGPGTKDNLKIPDVTEDKAKKVIDKNYLNPSKEKWGVSSEIAYKLADVSFNAGAGISTEVLQRSLTDLGYKVKADGKWKSGGETDTAYREAIAGGQDSILMQYIIKNQKKYYGGEQFNYKKKKISAGRVKQFYRGWEKRANYNPMIGEHTRGQ